MTLTAIQLKRTRWSIAMCSRRVRSPSRVYKRFFASASCSSSSTRVISSWSSCPTCHSNSNSDIGRTYPMYGVHIVAPIAVMSAITLEGHHETTTRDCCLFCYSTQDDTELLQMPTRAHLYVIVLLGAGTRCKTLCICVVITCACNAAIQAPALPF